MSVCTTRLDETKDRTNQRKRGVSFETAVEVFGDPYAVSYLDRVVDGERRWKRSVLSVGL